MRRLLESGAWLLVPGPKEEERGNEAALASALFAVLTLFSGIFPNSIFNQFGGLVDLAVIPFLVTVFLLSAVLHALPPGRPGARVSARVALTLASAAFIVWFSVVRLGLGAYGAPVAALLVLIFFCINHFLNRRRALRSFSPPAD